MRLRFASAHRTGSATKDTRLDELAVLLNRLRRHRAFDRRLVVSSVLDRFLSHLPARGGLDAVALSDVGGSTLSDRTMVDYLTESVRQELAFAHERLAG